MVSIYIDNYGCSANYDNGAIIAGLLLEKGYEITSLEEADIVIINSCSVKNVTVSKIFSRIKSIKDKKIIVTGCMALAEKERLKKLSLSLVNTDNITKIPEIIEDILEGEIITLLERRKESKLSLNKLTDKKVATIQIAEGCVFACSYCSTKLAKGVLHSFPKEEIIREVEKYVKRGFKRINLTSTDNGCYGFDLGYNLVDLLNEVLKIEGNFKVRVGMANPEHLKNIYKDLIKIYKNEKIIKFLHIPIQSGSNKVLREMNRKGTIEEFKEIVKTFRKNIPGMNISTDIIVGYPTETEEDFEKTLKLIKEMQFEVINISKFASRTGTQASKLKQLISETIKERSLKATKEFKSTKAK